MGLVAMTARIDRIKERLSVLVGTGYMAHRLSNLALAEIDGSWDDLSADDIPRLAGWLKERQSATNSELRVEWACISPPSRRSDSYETHLAGLPGPTACQAR
jgi:hypothetical protein